MNGSTLRDKDLVGTFLRRRDEASFGELYRMHSAGLYSLALRLSGWSESNAEDVLQEMWIRAICRLQDFRWESSLRTWLIGILIRCCKEKIRSAEPIAEFPIDSIVLRSSPTDWNIDLERSIASLPTGYRSVLILHDIEGYTHEEIGKLLGVEPGTSKSQLSNARKMIRNHFLTNLEKK